MLEQYQLSIPECVIAGVGCIKQLPALIEAEGKRNIALFADQGALKSGSLDETIAALKERLEKVTVVTDVPPEPEEGQVREIFSQVDTLKSYRLDVPQVTMLADELKKRGLDIPAGILKKEELVEALCRLS